MFWCKILLILTMMLSTWIKWQLMTANDQWDSFPDRSKVHEMFSSPFYVGGDSGRCCPQIYFVPDGLHWYEQRALNPDWSLGTCTPLSLAQKFSTITLGDTHTLLVSQMLLKLRSSENYEGNSQHTHVQIIPVYTNQDLYNIWLIKLDMLHNGALCCILGKSEGYENILCR